MPTSPSSFRLLLSALLLLACEAAPLVSTGERLEVRAPYAGLVSVGEHSAAVLPWRPALLDGLPPGPYTLTLEGEGQTITLLSVPGPVVDFGPLLGTKARLRGELISLSVQALRPGAAVVALSEDRSLQSETGEGLRRFRVPKRQRVTLLALWPDHMGVRQIEQPELSEGRALSLSPMFPLERELKVRLERLPGAWVEAELVYGGQDTSLLLGAGRLEPGQQLSFKLPKAQPKLYPFSIRLRALAGSSRRPDQLLSQRLSLETQEITLSWSSALELGPLPDQSLRPPPLRREGFSFLGDLRGCWWDLELRSLGCPQRRWRVISPGGGTELLLPSPQWDPLMEPLIETRLERVQLEGLSYEEFFSGEFSIRQLSTQKRRASWGYLQGEAPCPGKVEPQEFWLQWPAACEQEPKSAARLRLDSCGRLIHLEGESPLSCGWLEMERQQYLDQRGDRLELEEEEDGLRIGPYHLRKISKGESNFRELEGDWYWMEVFEEGEEREELLERSEGEQGPWLQVEEGLLKLQAPSWSLNALLEHFDGSKGRARIVDACPTPRWLEIKLLGGLLILREGSLKAEVWRR